VDVDGAAEIEVSGDTGILTTVGGRPARWRRFQCNTALPRNPSDFRYGKTAGRGSVRLLQDPRGNGGRAVLQINDPQGGRGVYNITLQWRGYGGGGWPRPGSGFPADRAIQGCQDAVTARLRQDGYANVNFERTRPDDNPGRDDWIVGTVSGRRDFRAIWFSFSCSVDFRSGRIRSVDVARR
jgi:hypothetical protein